MHACHPALGKLSSLHFNQSRQSIGFKYVGSTVTAFHQTIHTANLRSSCSHYQRQTSDRTLHPDSSLCAQTCLQCCISASPTQFCSLAFMVPAARSVNSCLSHRTTWSTPPCSPYTFRLMQVQEASTPEAPLDALNRMRQAGPSMLAAMALPAMSSTGEIYGALAKALDVSLLSGWWTRVSQMTSG